jgi:hypothetical protein
MHITFPALTVGTSAFLVVCYAMYMRTDDEVWLRMFRFWRRIFWIGFALGVVSGIVLTFEFALNWGRFAHDVGPIVGVIIAMEVVTAFFLEAGFRRRPADFGAQRRRAWAPITPPSFQLSARSRSTTLRLLAELRLLRGARTGTAAS